MDYKKFPKRFLRHAISFPFIWSLAIPIIISDVWVEIYHRVCFPLYGLRYVKRKDYIRIDRHKLSYLNWFEKAACAYCGYANGVIGYWVAVAGATEQYWCGIKHKKYNGFKSPAHHEKFIEYGDKENYSKLNSRK